MSHAKKVGILDCLVWLPVMGVSLLSRLLPLAFWCQLGQLFGRFFYLFGVPVKRIALINLKFAYGDELNDAQRRKILQQNFIHYGVGAFEWLRMFRMTEKRRRQICEQITIEGQEHLDAARRAKKKVILISGHYGFWEYVILKYVREINPLSFIVRRIDNALLEKERCQYHDRFGARILYKENGLREAIRGLNRGEDLLLLVDRKAHLHEGIPVEFFGHKTSTLSIAVTLAQKYDAAIVPMFAVRDSSSGQHKLVLEPALEIENLSCAEAVQLQNNVIEKAIRQRPDQWLWLHRKWKCYHKEIYK